MPEGSLVAMTTYQLPIRRRQLISTHDPDPEPDDDCVINLSASESDDGSLEATEPAKTVRHTTFVDPLTGGESTYPSFEYEEELEPVPEGWDMPRAAMPELFIPRIKSVSASALVSAIAKLPPAEHGPY